MWLPSGSLKPEMRRLGRGRRDVASAEVEVVWTLLPPLMAVGEDYCGGGARMHVAEEFIGLEEECVAS